MLSRIFNSVRASISNPQASRNTNTAPSKTILDETMVRTRKQEQVAIAQKEDKEHEEKGEIIHINAPSPPSWSQRTDKKRRKRHDESVDEKMTPAKKRKSLPVRAKDSDEEPITKNRPVVEIISMKPKSLVQKPIEVSEDEDEREKLSKSDSAHGDKDEETDDIVEPSQAVEKIKRNFQEEKHEVPSSNPEDNDSELEDQEETPLEEKISNKKHKRFASQENEDTFFSTAPEVIVIHEDEEEDSEDSDEAPEAVTIEDAAQTAKLKQREATNAFKEQVSASRKKRKEREDAIKKQQEKKRRKEERAAKREAARVAKTNPEAEVPLDTMETEPTVPSLHSRSSLHNLLPLEYLEDDNETPISSALLPSEPAKPTAKKTKFRDLVEKASKDKRVGSTTYRVVKASNKELAPKAAYNARKTKEAWLTGVRRGANGKLVGGGERKVMNKGFLKR